MSGRDVSLLFAGMAVESYDSAMPWYTRLFGRAPDVIVHDTEAMWQLADAGWVYVVEDQSRAGKGLLTLLVESLTDQLAQLESRGITTGEIETAPGRYRKAACVDPDGNTITFGESLGN
jgi:hypothetical protein